MLNKPPSYTHHLTVPTEHNNVVFAEKLTKLIIKLRMQKNSPGLTMANSPVFCAISIKAITSFSPVKS